MKTLNLVYANMREPRFEIALPERDAVAVWTVSEEPAADIVVYLNGYSYDARRAARNPDAVRMLYLYEPLVVWPRQFLKSFWAPFDAVLTWSEALLEQGGKFTRFPSLYYDFPFGAAHGIAGDPVCSNDWKNRKTALCQVAGSKHSLMPSELYSRRRKTARWFGRHGRLPLDTFGVPPMRVPGYRGRAADKRATLAQYRYALCFENDAHPVWSRGYVTEKIFDCFYAFTVPVYLGAADIEKHVPPECFVDFRRFSSLNALDEYLLGMTDEEYGGYLRAIERFLRAYDAPRKHSCFRLYETALDLAGARPAPAAEPSGFWQKASVREKICCAAMLAALPVHKAVCGTRYAGTR
jgi:hypothetical protein